MKEGAAPLLTATPVSLQLPASLRSEDEQYHSAPRVAKILQPSCELSDTEAPAPRAEYMMYLSQIEKSIDYDKSLNDSLHLHKRKLLTGENDTSDDS